MAAATASRRVLALAHVSSNGQHAYTERLQLCGRALQFVLLSAGQYEIRAVGRERLAMPKPTP